MYYQYTFIFLAHYHLLFTLCYINIIHKVVPLATLTSALFKKQGNNMIHNNRWLNNSKHVNFRFGSMFLTCWASSLVGASTRAWQSFSSMLSCCKIAMEKVAVLPVPDWAWAITSRPAIQREIIFQCHNLHPELFHKNALVEFFINLGDLSN